LFQIRGVFEQELQIYVGNLTSTKRQNPNSRGDAQGGCQGFDLIRGLCTKKAGCSLLHLGIQNIELYSTTIILLKLLHVGLNFFEKVS
jgi:hypothetical protein